MINLERVKEYYTDPDENATIKDYEEALKELGGKIKI